MHEEWADVAKEISVENPKMENHKVNLITKHEARRADYQSNLWCLDSGATTHLSGDWTIFDWMDQEYKGILTIANGQAIQMKGKGTVTFKLPNGQVVRLGEVLYIPGARENLMSMDLLLDNGIEHSCTSETNYTFTKQGKTIARGRRIGKASYLEWVDNTDSLFTGPEIGVGHQSHEHETYFAESTISQKELMHRRLGHPGVTRYNKLVNEMGVHELKLRKTDSNQCQVCLQAKRPKIQNHTAIPRSKAPLYKIHMDIWGPKQGFDDGRYYLSLIDDHTRFSWIFVIPNRKTQTIKTIWTKWIKRVERQTGNMVVVIRTDNAQEFNALETFTDDLGIEIEYMEAYTPAQNGFAE